MEGRIWQDKIRLRVLLGLFLVGILSSGCVQRWYGQLYDPSVPRPDFTLFGEGGPVSLSDFRGKMVILFFGYTSCPDVCPTTMAYARQTLKLVGVGPEQVQVIFVSVDWPTDTPETASRFAKEYSPDFVGLTGNQGEIEKVAKDFAVYYKINPSDAKGYHTVDHTANTFVLDRQGQLAMTWSYALGPQEMSRDLKILLGR